MAYVGEMQYLTIGSNTYSLPSSGGSGTVTSVAVSNATNGGLSISGSPVTSSGTITIGHSNVLTSAQSTQAVYPITIDKNGHISAYGSAVTVPSITLNGSSTTSPSFYAPTSAGTNGYVLKSNGSGAPTWGSAVLTDEKLKTEDAGNSASGYLIFGNATNAAGTKKYSTKFEIDVDSSDGEATLSIGDISIEGCISLGNGTNTYRTNIYTQTNSSPANIELPGLSGTLALTSDIPDVSGKIDTAGTGLSKSGTTLNHSNSITAQTTQAVYPIKIDAQGHISAYGSAVTVPTKVSDLTNDSGFVTTDEKLKTGSITSGTTYFPVVGSSSISAETKKVDLTGLAYIGTSGTSSADGSSILILGNATASGTSGNKEGRIRLWGTGDDSALLVAGALTDTRTITLPDKTGTIALTSDIPTVPTITLNGSSTTSPSFYAPTGAGTNGYVLTSSGSGAPSWTSGELTDTKNTAGSTNSTNTLYLIGATSQAANPQTYSNEYLYFNKGLTSIASVNSNNIGSSISQNSTGILLSVVDHNNDYAGVLNIGNNFIAIAVDDYSETYRLSVRTSGDIYAECIEFKIELDSTLDATLISDIANLGWTNDVIV